MRTQSVDKKVWTGVDRCGQVKKMSIAEKIKERLKNSLQSESLSGSIVKFKAQFKQVEANEYRNISYEEYRQQRILRMRLYEMSHIPMQQQLREIVNKMIQGGIIFIEDNKAGLKKIFLVMVKL